MTKPAAMIAILSMALIIIGYNVYTDGNDNHLANTSQQAPQTTVKKTEVKDNSFPSDKTHHQVQQPEKKTIKQRASEIGHKATETTKNGVEVVKKGYDKSKKGLKKGYQVSKEKGRKLKDIVVAKSKKLKEKTADKVEQVKEKLSEDDGD